MSHYLYSTRLYWQNGRGIAKLHNDVVHLNHAPEICGHPADCDVTPEVGVYMIRNEFEGWRDMTREEILSADDFLRNTVERH